MHSYLKSIGFSQYTHRKDVEELIRKVVENSSECHKICLSDKTAVAELSLDFAEDIGITVYGEYDEDNQFHFDHYFPYFTAKNSSVREEIFISKRVDTDAFTGMCDDYRLGVSLIFYLQNAIDYQISKVNDSPRIHSVTLAGLALEGKILLPVEKDREQINRSTAESKQRDKLIAEAKRGNQDAIDSLTIDDIDLYAMISKRVRYEDIYSIVDTCFIPYGSESDNYSVLGTILDYRTIVNQITKEVLLILQIDCNHLIFDICINKNDLQGEVQIGRRFRGNIWMQGYIDFTS